MPGTSSVVADTAAATTRPSATVSTTLTVRFSFSVVVARRSVWLLSYPVAAVVVVVLPRVDFFSLAGSVVPPATERGFPPSDTNAAAAAVDAVGTSAKTVVVVAVVVVVPATPLVCLLSTKRATY